MPGSRPEWTPGTKGEVSEFVLCSLWTAGRCGLHPPPHARDTCAHGPPGASFSYMNRMLSFLSFCYWPSFFKPLLQPPGLSPPSAPAQQISLQGRMSSLLPCGAQVCWSFSSSSGVLWLIPQRSALVSPPPGSLLGFPSDQMQEAAEVPQEACASWPGRRGCPTQCKRTQRNPANKAIKYYQAFKEAGSRNRIRKQTNR